MKRFILILLCLFLCSFTYIRRGQTSYGTIAYNIENNQVRRGQTSYGAIVYNIDGKYIRKGISKYGTVAYNIDGKYIREGISSYGRILGLLNNPVSYLEANGYTLLSIKLKEENIGFKQIS